MRIAVLRALGLGDLLTAVPALRALRDAFPEAELALACPAWLHELVELWDLADEAVAVGPLEPLPAALARADLAVNLHGRGPASTRLLVETRPAELVAFAHPAVTETACGPLWLEGEHEIARWCRLLRESGIDADAEQLELEAPPLYSAKAGIVLLHPGAASQSRRWPVERWAEIARVETARGERVVVTGSAAERDLAERISWLAGLGPTSVRAGGSLTELAALVGLARLVVCGDTGVAHLATALGTPSVVLFGPVPPAEWGPPASRRRRHRALWAGRRGDPHGTAPDPGLLELSVEDVLAEIEDLDGFAPTPPLSARA